MESIHITLDTQKVIKSQNIKVTKGDSAIQFVVKIQRNGEDNALQPGTIYTLSNLRLDGVVVLSPTGVVTGENEVAFLLGTTETEVVGTVRASVQMYHVDGRVSTISFTYNVMRDLSSDYVPSESEKTLIESVLVEGPVVIGQAKDLVKKMDELIEDGVEGITGEKGDPGDIGPIGLTGLTGPTGDQGIQGERGVDGEPGPRGEQGERGDTGPKGNDGEQGIIGPRGENGTDGKDGLPGIQGEKGEPGERGLPGENGSDGKDGKDGLSGPAGEDGERGIDGLQGPAGADGEPGPRGADGANGAPGEQGIQGLPGTDGLQGERGPKGDPGPAPDVSLFATKPEVKSAMDRAEEAFTQANDGKTLVAVAVTVKGVSASPADTFSQLAVKIGRIESVGTGGNEGIPIGPTITDIVVMSAMNVTGTYKIVLEDKA